MYSFNLKRWFPRVVDMGTSGPRNSSLSEFEGVESPQRGE